MKLTVFGYILGRGNWVAGIRKMGKQNKKVKKP